jgi:hypothetical protein
LPILNYRGLNNDLRAAGHSLTDEQVNQVVTAQRFRRISLENIEVVDKLKQHRRF